MAKKTRSVSPQDSTDMLRQQITALEAELAKEKAFAAKAHFIAEQYRRAIENAPDVILSLDRAGNIIFTNETPSHLPLDALIGKSVFEFIATEEHRKKLSDALRHVLETGNTASYEHQDGDGLWHATRVSPIKIEDEIVAVSVIGTNIDDYKRLEAEHARVLEAERKQRELAEALRDAGTAFSSTLDLDTIIDALLTQISRVVPYDAANVMVVENGIARITQARGYNDFGQVSLDEIQGLTFNIFETPNLRTMYETKQPLIVPDTSKDVNWVHVRPKTSIRSWAGAPIIVQDEVVAFFSLDKAEANFYRPTDAEQLEGFAGQAAVAIKNARLYQDVRRVLAKTEALHTVGQSLIEKLTLDDVLQTVVDSIAEALPAYAVILSTLNLDEEKITHFVKGGKGAHEIDDVSYDTLKDGLTGWVLQEQSSLLSHQHLSALFEKQPAIPTPKQAHPNVIAVPLRYQDTVLGTVTAINRETDPPYTKNDVDLMEAMASQAAVAIQNAALYEESRKQAQLVQQILDSVPQGILLLDKDYRVQLCNPPTKQLLPLFTDEYIKNEPLTRLGNLPLSSLLNSIGKWHELVVKDGEAGIYMATAQPIQALGDSIEGWVLVFHDITNERALQQRIQQQERLAAVGQMAAGIAHDFNNILTSIIGFADLLNRRTSTSPTAKPLLSNIIAQGQKGAQLIGQILDFSRQSVSQKKPVGVASFLSDTIKLLRRLIPENIALVEEIADELASVVLAIDPAQIQQVLTNLAINARDAMPHGGTITFSLSSLTLADDDPRPFPSMPSGKWLHLAISDTGEGIDDDTLSHIFEPFFTTKEVGKGTGLGLSQAYGIMKQHGGYITAESTVGQGTTINLFLPLSEQALTAQISVDDNDQLPHGSGQTLLLVEDDLAVLTVGKAMLNHLGYKVLTAKDGYEALAEFDRHHDVISLVLTDITMPRLGGMALAKQLKSRNPNIPIIALTGYPLKDSSKKLLSEGFVDWLPKPLDVDQLATAVAKALA